MQAGANRGLISSIKDKAVWSTLAEAISGGLFSLGAFGSGAEAVKKKEDFTSWLRGHRRETYGVLVESYDASLKRGQPMFRDKNFWISIAGAVALILTAAQGFIPENTIWAAIAGAVLMVLNFVRGSQNVETAKHEAVAARALVQARQLEARNLERAIAANQVHKIELGGTGLDQEL